MLTDRTWKLEYTPDDAGSVELFAVSARPDAVSLRLGSPAPQRRPVGRPHRATTATPLALYLERFVVDNEP